MIYLLYNKPHNKHYLDRYIKFILSCNNQDIDSKYEKHHILPKSKDLFPEFKSFTLYPWNQINLSYRQHYIAHMLLFKAFRGSQARAFALMSNRTQYSNSKIYESAKEHISNSMSGEKNPNANGLQSKKAWASASLRRRKKQSDIMKAVNKLKRLPKEFRNFLCSECSSTVIKEEFKHHLPKEHYYCNPTCRNKRTARNRRATRLLGDKGKCANPQTGLYC